MVWCSARLDASGAALGRRYARMDELGVPFGMTVDFQTIEDSTVTLRERDSMTQIRLPLSDVAPLVEELVKGACSWKVRLLADSVEEVGWAKCEEDTRRWGWSCLAFQDG